MGWKLMKCPACGSDLNLETDRDYAFCQYCGAKLLREENRIVIEHIDRKIDEAEIKRINFEEKKFDKESKSRKKFLLIANVVCAVVSIVGVILDNTSGRNYKLATTGLMMWYLGLISLFCVDLSYLMKIFSDKKNDRR